MRHDPYAARNRVHREQVDTPWSEPSPRHRFRAQWQGRRSRYDFPSEPLLVRFGHWLHRHRLWIELPAFLGGAYILGRFLFALATGAFE